MIEKIKSDIPSTAIDAIKEKILDLNNYIESVENISRIGDNIKTKMDDTVGLHILPILR